MGASQKFLPMKSGRCKPREGYYRVCRHNHLLLKHFLRESCRRVKRSAILVPVSGHLECSSDCVYVTGQADRKRTCLIVLSAGRPCVENSLLSDNAGGEGDRVFAGWIAACARHAPALISLRHRRANLATGLPGARQCLEAPRAPEPVCGLLRLYAAGTLFRIYGNSLPSSFFVYTIIPWRLPLTLRSATGPSWSAALHSRTPHRYSKEGRSTGLTTGPTMAKNG